MKNPRLAPWRGSLRNISDRRAIERQRPDTLSKFLHRARRQAWGAIATDTLLIALLAATLTAIIVRRTGHSPVFPAAAVFLVALTTALFRRPTLPAIAASLDARYHTGDLLLSAWLTAPTDAWSAALRAAAAARAVALPPVGRPVRFTVRHHLCAIAAAGAAGLMSQLPAASPEVASMVVRSDSTPMATALAAERIRRPDAGETPVGREFTPLVPASSGNASHRARPAGDDARGSGRADASGPARPLPAMDAATVPEPAAGGLPGGSGIAATPGEATTALASGNVLAERAGETDTSQSGNARNAAGPGHSTAAPVPDAYRGLVHDFFSR